MKKLRLLGIILLSTFAVVLPNAVSAQEKVNVYIFRGEGCPHCEEALEFFDKLSKDEEYSKYYNLKKYEVWYDEDNAKLMEKVASELNETASGVPYIVIGKKTFSGYSEETGEQIKIAIKEAYDSISDTSESKKTYKDVVKSVQKGTTEKKDKGSAVPIVITIGVAVFIIAGLVVLTKKM